MGMNILRLADSPLLLDGLDEFVAHWLGTSPALTETLPSREEQDWLSLFPPEVTQYWQMIHRWPGAYLGGSQDDFAGTSTFLSREPQNGEVILVNEAQSVWTISWNFQEEELWVEEDESRMRLPCTIAQFLVTFGLYSLALGYWSESTDGEAFFLDEEPVPDAIAEKGYRLWSGIYQSPEEPIEWWYAPEPGVMWHTFHGMTIFSSREEGGSEWIEERLP